MKTLKILLTGASGFVGRSFVKQFENDPSVLIHGLGRSPMPENERYSQKDISKPFDLDFEPDVVIHAAARSLPWGSKKEFHEQNVTATQNVIDFCLKKNTESLIYISSGSVFYQEKDQFGITEESPIGPPFVNIYAKTKYQGERLLTQFPRRSAILRPRAVFGPGDTVLFPRILQAAQKGKMLRFTRTGLPVKGDLIYIDTLCDYMMRAAKDSRVCGAFNLTNNQPVEIEAFLNSVFLELGIPPPRKSMPQRRALAIASAIEFFYKIALPKSEPPLTRFGIVALAYSKTFNVAKTLETLGPPSVDLQTGIKRFLEWQKSRLSQA